MSEITILHLSDIHFKNMEDEDYKTTRKDLTSKMIKTIKTHFEKISKNQLDYIAVTGDISFNGKDYDDAEKFFDELIKIIPKESVFLPVPGNHDVNRDGIKKSVSLYNIVKEDKIEHFLNDKDDIHYYITPKFKEYKNFSEKISPDIYELEDDYFWVKNFHDKNVSFMGLNSAWACEGDNDRFNIALGYPQVFDALGKTTSENKIVLMHHPPVNWLKDFEHGKSRSEIFKNCFLVLFGHTHADKAYIIEEPSSSCICLGANASYTNDKNGFVGFQFLNIEFKKNGFYVRVWPYIYDHDRRNDFIPDRERYRSQNGKEFFTLSSYKHDKEKPTKPGIVLKIPEQYKEWVEEFFSTIPVDHLAKKGEVINIRLPEIYIPLETSNPLAAAKREKITDKKAKKEDTLKESAPINIEELLGKINLLLIRGHAGMGKTTLIKHMAFTITQGSAPEILNFYLPIIIFLKDLWPIYKDKINTHKLKINFEDLLKIYLEKNRCPLNMELILGFLSQKKVLFLFDGLDEIPEKICGDLVDILHEFWVSHKENKFIFTGRPHGFSNKVVEKFGETIQDIEPLNNKNIEAFIIKWFRAVSVKGKVRADLTSGDMINDVRLHEYVSVFTQNPLLLTGICILYIVSGQRIPEQRSDLYDRIVENLLYRRFHDPQKPEKIDEVREFIMNLAFSMQKQGLKKVDVHEAKEMLKKVYPQNQDENPIHYNRRVNELFDDIEPGCGMLIRLISGEIEFFHLTFQEFMAAKHILNMDLDINRHLSNKWWEETILLYTGLMSHEMKKRCNDFIFTIFETVKKDEKNKNYLVLLASKALRDIPSTSKRSESNLDLAVKKLHSIIKTSKDVKERFEAGDILGTLGDLRIKDYPMVHVEAGEFIRGSEEYDDDEKPSRQIYLDEFMMGKYSVTNQEFRAFVQDGGYENKELWTSEGLKWLKKENIFEPLYWHDRKWSGPNFPVVGVSWYEAAAYAQWLSNKTGDEYALPTEAQWEKAARGPDGKIYPWGDKFNKNFCNSSESGLGRTSSVGIFLKNKSPYGCMDMAGNVWEWCTDWYKKDYYNKSPDKNPQGPPSGSTRVIRGGGWYFGDWYCRAACRNWHLPAYRGVDLGFRLVRSL